MKPLLPLFALLFAPELAGAPAHAQELQAGIRGRFLLSDGRPAPGVRVVVDGFQSNEEDAREHGLPWGWQPLVATTDGDGRFELAFRPPQAFQMEMDAVLAGFVPMRWKWFVLPPDAWTDVGEVALEHGETMRVHIRASDGAKVDGCWHYEIVTSRVDLGEEGDPIRIRSWGVCEDGSFVIPDLPSGPARITLSAGAERIESQVSILRGRPTRLDVVLEGPWIPGSAECDGVHPAAWSWPPPSEIRPRPRGDCSVRLTVIDASTGERVEDYALKLLTSESPVPYSVWLRGAAPSDGVLDGLWSAAYVLLVESPVHQDLELPVTLASAEMRELTAELNRAELGTAPAPEDRGEPAGLYHAGRVRASADVAFGGFHVIAAPLPVPWGHSLREPEIWPGAVFAPVGADGRFRVGPVPAGAAKLFLAIREDGYFYQRSEIASVDSSVPETLELDIDHLVPGRIVVDVRVNGERRPGLFVVGTSPVSPLTEGAACTAFDMTPLQSRFELEPLFPGTWWVAVFPQDPRWVYEHRAAVEIAPGEERVLSVHVELHRGSLRLLDAATGAPLAHRNVGIIDGCPPFRTDGEGHVELELPAGTWRVWDLGSLDVRDPHDDAVPFEWTAGGPVPGEVRLPKYGD